MEAKARLSNLRVSPRKVQYMVDQVRGKGINEAINILNLSPRKNISGVLKGLLKSAVANADQKGLVDVDTLFVKTIFVGAGPTLKRFMTRAKGSASRIHKRTSHVTVTLAEK